MSMRVDVLKCRKIHPSVRNKLALSNHFGGLATRTQCCPPALTLSTLHPFILLLSTILGSLTSSIALPVSTSLPNPSWLLIPSPQEKTAPTSDALSSSGVESIGELCDGKEWESARLCRPFEEMWEIVSPQGKSISVGLAI